MNTATATHPKNDSEHGVSEKVQTMAATSHVREEIKTVKKFELTPDYVADLGKKLKEHGINISDNPRFTYTRYLDKSIESPSLIKVGFYSDEIPKDSHWLCIDKLNDMLKKCPEECVGLKVVIKSAEKEGLFWLIADCTGKKPQFYETKQKPAPAENTVFAGWKI